MLPLIGERGRTVAPCTGRGRQSVPDHRRPTVHRQAPESTRPEQAACRGCGLRGAWRVAHVAWAGSGLRRDRGRPGHGAGLIHGLDAEGVSRIAQQIRKPVTRSCRACYQHRSSKKHVAGGSGVATRSPPGQLGGGLRHVRCRRVVGLARPTSEGHRQPARASRALFGRAHAVRSDLGSRACEYFSKIRTFPIAPTKPCFLVAPPPTCKGPPDLAIGPEVVVVATPTPST